MITDRLSLGPPRMGGASGLGLGAKLQPESRAKDKESSSFELALQEKDSQQEIQPMSKETKSQSRALDQAKDRAPVKADQQKNLSVSRKKESGEEVEVTKASEQSEPASQKPVLNQKQKVMQKFMDSIESEFSIPPERIVEAMAMLSDEDLLKSPEETASQIISKLELDPEDESRAEALYVSMLTDLSKVPQQPIIENELAAQATYRSQINPALSGMSAQSNNMDVMSQKERRALLNDSLDRMNNKFFMTQPMKAQQALKPEVTQQLSQGGEDVYGQVLSSDQSVRPVYQSNTLDTLRMDQIPRDLGSPQLAQARQAQYAEMQQALMSPELLQAQMQNPEVADPAYQELAAKLAVLGASAAALNEVVVKDPQNVKALHIEDAMSSQGQVSPKVVDLQQLIQAPSMSGRQAFEGGQEQFSGGEKSFSEKEMVVKSKSEKPAMGKEEFFPQPTDGNPQPLKNESTMGLAAGGAGSQIGQKVADGESEANIRQLLNQTQYMMKKGGGEAVVKLTPEGLGQVHLKVVVNEGKVNLEMSAESKEAKKIIESSIGDLKSSLHTRNLSVDSIKVDVGNQLSSDNNSQSQNQSSQFKFDQGREQARQFMQNFQEQNSSQRGGFFEMPGLKTYGQRNNPDPLKPANENSARSRRYEGTGKGAGVDLVA